MAARVGLSSVQTRALAGREPPSPSRVLPAPCPATAFLGPALGCPRATCPDPPRPPLGRRVNPKETSPPELALLSRLARESLSPDWAATFPGAHPIPSSDPPRKSLHQRDRRWRWVERETWQESFSGGVRGAMGTPIWPSRLHVTSWV